MTDKPQSFVFGEIVPAAMGQLNASYSEKHGELNNRTTVFGMALEPAVNVSRTASGFGMIEILVALLLISVGFFNMAGLQTAAKKAAYDSLQRTSAVILARDISEKMRANPASLNRYITAGNGVGGGTLNEPAQGCTFGEQCNPNQLADYDLWLWEQALDGATESRTIDGHDTNTGGLVSPTACITGPAGGAAGVYTITIVWRGLNELTNVSQNACGTGLNRYGDNDEYRRILSINAYIAA